MSDAGLALFDTAIGRCGVAWRDPAAGVAAVQLPGATAAVTRASLRRRVPEARPATPPPAVQQAIDAIVALLDGAATDGEGAAGVGAADLGSVALDMDGVPPFHREVYEAARTIPVGTTLSYGDLAARAGQHGAARAVGQALGRNPFAIVVPCHRVIAAGGQVGGFSAEGGVATKLRMLAAEGAPEAGGTPAPTRARARAGGPAPVATAPHPVRRRHGRRVAFGVDPMAAVDHLRAADPVMAQVIEAVGPFTLEADPAPSVFLGLAQAIVYQQLNGRAASTIHGRLVALFPASPDGPTPQDLLGATDDALRGAGLSRAKVAALRDLAARVDSGQLPTLAQLRKMDDDTVVDVLSAVRGIGRWTAEMFLMFRLGRPDVLPLDDFGVRKAFGVVIGSHSTPGKDELAARGLAWAPYRSVASWYLWRALEVVGPW